MDAVQESTHICNRAWKFWVITFNKQLLIITKARDVMKFTKASNWSKHRYVYSSCVTETTNKTEIQFFLNLLLLLLLLLLDGQQPKNDAT